MKPSSWASVPGFQRFLRTHGLAFACAESCTGGLLSRQMTGRAGSSDVFWGGAVTYSNQAKGALLGVPDDVLAQFGAVSGPVALAMVEGLVHRSGVPLAVAITGIAGPGGATDGKPVGTVWFGLAARVGDTQGSCAARLQLAGTRGQIQGQAARWARVLAAQWWVSRLDLDSLRALTDNEGKSLVVAFQPPKLFPPSIF